MKKKIKQAIAILNSGRSFEEASKISGIDTDELIRIWNELKSN